MELELRQQELALAVVADSGLSRGDGLNGQGVDASIYAGPLRALDLGARLRLLLLVAAALVVAVALGLQALTLKDHDGYVFAVLAHGLAYCVGVWVVVTARLGGRALLWILAIALVLRAIVFLAPVGITTDGFRYIWDGRLQAAGINPYLTVPADPILAQQRDDSIYPNINGRDTYPTIYPPVAQMAFLVGTRIIDSIDGVKLLMGLAEGGIIVALLGWLAALRLPRERVLIYAWHPLPMWEFTGHGHVDTVAVMFVTLAVWAAARGRSGWAGSAFAAAALVKYWPIYFAAAIWRRFDWRLPAAALVTALLLYVPYVWPEIIGFGFAGVGIEKLAGSLFKHLNDEGYNAEGWGFFLAFAPKHFGWFVVSGGAYAKFAAATLLGIGLAIAFKRKPQVFETWPMLLLVAAFLLMISPHYPWYYAIAVPFLTCAMYPPLLWVTLVVTAIYIEIDYVWLTPYPRFKVYLAVYGGFITLAVLTWWVSRSKTRAAD